jgi:hypothetical protein
MNARTLRTLLIVAALGAACDRSTSSSTSSLASSPPPQAEAAQAQAPPPAGPPPETLATKLPADAVRAALPELPLMASPRSRGDVIAAYEFAALHPEVLKYVPCYCGCERTGHQHNESCFVASREADGRVLSWDAHGMG